MRGWMAGVVLMSIAGTASADSVQLLDGSVLNGRVLGMSGGVLRFETGFAGELPIGAARVSSIQTDGPVRVQLADGRTVEGRLAQDQEGRSVLIAPFGVEFVQASQIRGISPGGASSPAQAIDVQASAAAAGVTSAPAPADAGSEADTPADEAGEQSAEVKDEWKIRLEFGLNGKSGNAEILNFRGGAYATRETDRDVLDLFAEGAFGEEDGERSENEFEAGAEYRRDINDRWFWYANAGFRYDEIQDLDARITGIAGLGYYIIREDTTEFLLRGGVGYQHESYGDGRSENDAILELGYDFSHEFNEDLKFVSTLDYYPTLDNFTRDYRLELENGIEVPISDDEAWKIKAGVRNDYNSRPADDRRRMDTSYFLNLVYEFK